MQIIRVLFLILLFGITSLSQTKPEQQPDAKREVLNAPGLRNPSAMLEDRQKDVREHPDSAEAHYHRGQAYRQGGDKQQAIEEFNFAIAVRPDYAEVYNELGWVYYNSQKGSEDSFQQAVDAFSMAVRINPKLAEAYQGLGLVYRDAGKVEEAVEALKKAAEIDPQETLVLSNLKLLYEQLGRYDEAIKVVLQRITEVPTPVNHFDLGKLYLKVNRPEDTIAAYKEGLRINLEQQNEYRITNAMRKYLGWQILGELYIELGRYQEAIEPCQREIHENPKNPSAYRVLMMAYRKLGLTKEAVETGKQMIEVLPDEPEAQFEIGNLYLELGDKATAWMMQKKLAETAKRTKQAGSESDSERYAKILLEKINRWIMLSSLRL